MILVKIHTTTVRTGDWRMRKPDPAVRQILFTCPDCYGDLLGIIGIYRLGLEEADGKPVLFEAAVSDWYEEVYRPAMRPISKSNLVVRFPNRTAAICTARDITRDEELEKNLLSIPVRTRSDAL